MCTALGTEIESWRTGSGLARMAVGRFVGVDHMTVYRWERKGATPNPENMQKLEEMGFRAQKAAA